jgi:D-alanyl-D-alanine carboxypeptidase
MTSPVVDVDRLDALVTRHLDGRVPGAALAVVRSGETVFSRCHGMADLEWRQPVTPTTVFRLASLSKPFTALTAMLLARDGLLDLDAPVSRYLSHPLPHAGTVRVRHLLSHTSGIPNFVVQPSFAGRTSRIDHTDEEVVARFASLPLHFEPGSRYSYNNSAYRLLDMVVAGVTGGSFADALTERVLAPAGMTDTRVLSDQEIVPERARGYDADGPDGFANAPYVSMTLPGGAGGMGSTLRDLARFDRALSAGVVADEQMQRRLFQPVTLTGAGARATGWAGA